MPALNKFPRAVRGCFVLTGFLLMAGLAGCSSVPTLGSWFGPKKVEASQTPPEQLYKKGDELLSKGDYEGAATNFEEVDRQHPYSPYARRSIVMSAYAHYKLAKYAEALAGARRYVTLHPGTKESALAQFIIASSYFDEIKDPSRDQGRTKKALRELKVLVRRYPDSRYAKQARNRIRIAQDVIAASEMSVGRYYLKKRNYLAAINRFKTVARDYQTTQQVEESLMRLTEAYMALGIKSEAQTAAAVLGHNFPESKWYKDAYVLLKSDGLAPRENTGSWLSRAWKNVKKINPF